MAHKFFVDLFAGCGGLSLGLEQAGFTPILVNEISPYALETYLVNRDHQFPHLRNGYAVSDVQELTDSNHAYWKQQNPQIRSDFSLEIDKGELDLLVGGPPCQGFSGLGHRRTHRVHRQDIPSNHLYLQMVNLINYLNPRMFLFENVRGLRSAKWTPAGTLGEVWAEVSSAFKSLTNYRVKDTVVFGKDYGVPQFRPRVLIVGMRNDLPFTPIEGMPADGLIPKATSRAPDLIDILSDLIDPKYSNGGVTRSYPHEAHNELQEQFRQDPRTLRTRGKGGPLTEHGYSKHSEKVQSRFMYMMENNGTNPEGFSTKKFSQRLLPSRWGEAGPTITAASMPDDYVHFSQPRSLTVREWARLQTFPDWYEFYGPRTTGGAKRAGTPAGQFLDRELPKYTQIGNAVPVLLAKAIGDHFSALLDRARE